MRKPDVWKAVRIALGSSLSFLLCHLLGFKYAPSAAVITLLCTQETKKDTLIDVVKRVISYLFAIGLAFLLYNSIGYNFLAFYVFLVILVLLGTAFNLTSTLSSSTVVTTHFLLDGTFSHSFVFQEIMLLLIGTGFAMLLNVFIKDYTFEIKAEITKIEKDMKTLLESFSECIDKSPENISRHEEWFEPLEKDISTSKEKAIKNADSFDDEVHYYTDYLDMRDAQQQAIKRIYNDLKEINLNAPLPLKDDIVAVFADISSKISKPEGYDITELTLKRIQSDFNLLPMPKTRGELENMAIVRDVLNELYFFAEVKRDYIEKLSDSQRKKYYSDYI